jgi:hypothetical protein
MAAPDRPDDPRAADGEPAGTEPSATHDPLELIAAVLLGFAAVAISWSTYQSALWGGRQDEAYTESVREADNAVDLLQAADTTRSLDQSLFVEVLTSGVCEPDPSGDTERCELVLATMSPAGRTAVEEWLATDGSTAPFDSDDYLDSLYGAGDGATRDSQVFFDEAGEANEFGDDFELAVTLLTVVMFFAGISVVLKDGTLRRALLAVAGLVLVGSLGFVLGLPSA